MTSSSSFVPRSSARIAKSNPKRERRLFLESLEDRALLAAGVGDVKEATRLGSDLAAIQTGAATFAGPGETNALASGLMQRSDGRIAIEAIAAGDTSQLVGDLTAAGIEVTSSYGRIVGAWISIEQIAALENLASLKFARATAAVSAVGATDSQGDVAMRTDEVRTALGFDGTGVTVGVISDSFNTSGNGSYAADIASGDLPTGINVVQDLAGATDEGRAMLQLIHDVAPGANLAFATAGGSAAAFAKQHCCAAGGGLRHHR